MKTLFKKKSNPFSKKFKMKINKKRISQKKEKKLTFKNLKI